MFVSVLDMLLEKKDLRTYILTRIKHLKKQNIASVPKKDREHIKINHNSRIAELRFLRKLLDKGELKQKSKEWWK